MPSERRGKDYRVCTLHHLKEMAAQVGPYGFLISCSLKPAAKKRILSPSNWKMINGAPERISMLILNMSAFRILSSDNLLLEVWGYLCVAQ